VPKALSAAAGSWRECRNEDARKSLKMRTAGVLANDTPRRNQCQHLWAIDLRLGLRRDSHQIHMFESSDRNAMHTAPLSWGGAASELYTDRFWQAAIVV